MTRRAWTRARQRHTAEFIFGVDTSFFRAMLSRLPLSFRGDVGPVPHVASSCTRAWAPGNRSFSFLFFFCGSHVSRLAIPVPPSVIAVIRSLSVRTLCWKVRTWDAKGSAVNSFWQAPSSEFVHAVRGDLSRATNACVLWPWIGKEGCMGIRHFIERRFIEFWSIIVLFRWFLASELLETELLPWPLFHQNFGYRIIEQNDARVCMRLAVLG